jgi:hypothetical protein
MIVTQGSAMLDVYAVFCTELHKKLRYSKNGLFLSLILYITRLAVIVHCCEKPTPSHERCAECSSITKYKPNRTYMHKKHINSTYANCPMSTLSLTVQKNITQWTELKIKCLFPPTPVQYFMLLS